MNRREHLLTCLAEECTEVGQRVTKALRFGLDEVQTGQDLTNRQRIAEEYRDLVAVAAILVEEGILAVHEMAVDQKAVDAKRARIERFMEISRREGVLS
jgi:NTP pyrophosphatase (non-canonical NTP hydrolase)